ncbi:MAG TPA: sulfotransferase [Acidimicrobiales bacterium]|nr:sulfotransferase [Acidimicrobiales bacterium]
MGLPDFFVIGAPKAGTTALHRALARHPQLWLSPIKEPKYFMCDGAPPSQQGGPGDAHSAREWVWRREEYERLFDAAPPGVLAGEATPFYLWDRAAHARMAATVPRAKLVAIVRDPVDRAYSNWTHLWVDGLEPRSDFLAACDEEGARAAAGWAPFWRYQGLGRYGEQLEHLFLHFPREQVHVLRYRNLIDRPAEALDRICRFLGVAEGRVSSIPASNVSNWVEPPPVNRALPRAVRVGAIAGARFHPRVWRVASAPLLAMLQRSGQRHRPGLTAEQRTALTERFRADVELLGDLLGRSYADWLSSVDRGTFSTRSS